MADIRITQLSTTEARPKKGAFIETDHASEGSRKLDLGFFDDGVNPRAAQGALAFDGSAGGRVYGSIQAFNADDFSIHVKVQIPTAPVSGFDPVLCAIGTTSNPVSSGLQFALQLVGAGDFIYAGFYSGSEYRAAKITSVCATWGGKVVQLTVTRSGTTVKIFINGQEISQAANVVSASPPAFSMSLTGTFAQIGSSASATAMRTGLYSLSLYNLALSQADVTEIQELGGGVPERLKWGNQSQYLSNFSVSYDGWNNGDANQTITPNVDGINGSDNWAKLESTNSAQPLYNYPTASTTPGSAGYAMGLIKSGRRVRVRATIFNPSGSLLTKFGIYIQGSAAYAGVAQTVAANTEHTWSDEIENLGSAVIGRLGVRGSDSAIGGVATTGQLYYVKNIRIVPLGAVAHYDADLDGIGYQLHDQSSNKLDATITASGVSWTKPARTGYVRGTLTWSGTHEAKSLIGQACIPPEAALTLVALTPSASTSGSGALLGTAADNGRFVAAAVPLTANQKKPISLFTPLPATGATVGSSHLDLVVDPDGANYTGSIVVDVRYAVTEGNP